MKQGKEIMMESIVEITNKLSTVDDLVKAGELIRVSQDTLKAEKVELKTLYDQEECLVGIGIFPETGDYLPTHKHVGIVQYLIQFTGKCSVEFEKGGYRILTVGECATVPMGENHKVTALQDNSQQVFVCVPAERGYSFEEATEPNILGRRDG